MAKKSVAKTVTRNLREVEKQTKSFRKVTKSKSRNSKPAKPSKQEKFEQLQEQRSYTLRDLPIPQKKTFAAYYAGISDNIEELESLAEPGEYWTAEFYGHKILRVFRTLQDLLDYLNKYETVQQFGRKHSRNPYDDLVNNIKLLKFKPRGWRKPKDVEVEESNDNLAVDQWNAKKKRETKKRVKEESEVRETAAKFTGIKKGGRMPSKTNLLKGVLEKAQAMQAALEDANKRIAELEKALAKKAAPKKAAQKKSAKKAGQNAKRKQSKPNKQVAKKQVSKKQATSKKVAAKPKAKNKANKNTKVKTPKKRKGRK